MTRGRRLLLAVLRRTKQAALAKRCKVTQQAVSLWAVGYRTPSERARRALFRNYQIPEKTWANARRNQGYGR